MGYSDSLFHKLRYPLVFGAILAGINFAFRHRADFVHEGREERQQEARRKTEAMNRELAGKINTGK